MPLYDLGNKTPMVPEAGRYWLAPDAHVIGDVVLAEDVGIWFGAVLRGDNDLVSVGARTNIQEHAMVHADPGYPASIGADVTVGHRAIVHGCTIGDNTLVGMGAIILNGARVGNNCLVGAGALVTEGKVIPDNSVVMGSPGQVVKTLDETAVERLRGSALHYVRNWKRFAVEMRCHDEEGDSAAATAARRAGG